MARHEKPSCALALGMGVEMLRDLSWIFHAVVVVECQVLLSGIRWLRTLKKQVLVLIYIKYGRNYFIDRAWLSSFFGLE